jgi:hypothetical protein
MTFRLRELECEGPKYFARKRESWGDFRKGLTRAREKSPGVCLPPGLFLNVHKIRVDSDNKR